MTVSAVLNYIDPACIDPTVYYVDPPDGVPVSTVGYAPHRVEINDARDSADPVTLDRDGVAFLPLPIDYGSFDNLEDVAAVRAEIYPPLEEYARELFHTDRAVVIEHAFRRRTPVTKLRADGRQRTPLQQVHCDFTPEGVPGTLRRTLGDEAYDLLPDSRFLFLNFWAPLVGPLRDDPLAVCAPATVTSADLIPIRHIYKDGPGSIYGVAYNPGHSWHFMSDMQPDEAVAFVLFDNRRPTSWYTPHTAFALPPSNDEVPPRASIEVRLVVVPS